MTKTQKQRGRVRGPDIDMAENTIKSEWVQKSSWEDPACDTCVPRAECGDQSVQFTKKYEQISWMWAEFKPREYLLHWVGDWPKLTVFYLNSIAMGSVQVGTC